jgi:hypothetical protein
MNKIILNTYILLNVLFVSSIALYGQNLDDLLALETANEYDYAVSTFMSSRIVNGQSVEQMQKGGLDFRISHRFGSFKTGKNELYGLDKSNSYFTVDYGLFDHTAVGLGRATSGKLVTADFKSRILRQLSGAKNIPFTISLYGALSATTQTFTNTERNEDLLSRLEYTGQLLIARKFNDFSFQLSPTYVHRNLVETPSDLNVLYALGLSGRYKISSIIDVSAEYFWVSHSGINELSYHNPLSFAVSYQTSRHVFQLLLTNSYPAAINSVIGNTIGAWAQGDIRLGFNISTVF